MTAASIHFDVVGVLLDIEGTTSPIRYVTDVLFPFAKCELKEFATKHWHDPDFVLARDLVARDCDHNSFAEWIESRPAADKRPPIDQLCEELDRLMALDAKATGLKAVQGLIWQAGYRDGKLLSQIYPDVAPALQRRTQTGLDVRIYSSGSIAAQKVFFEHSAAGNLERYLNGHYDTTTGPKKEPASYKKIASAMNLSPEKIVFVSDILAELDAARSAGLKTVLSLRPGNAPVENTAGHPVLTSFDQLDLSLQN